jgi:hypothetical protein
MPRPSQLPTWATDANYTAGSDNGTPTKILIPSGVRSQGWERDLPALAQYLNEWENEVGEFVTWLDQVTAAASDVTKTYPLLERDVDIVQRHTPIFNTAEWAYTFSSTDGAFSWTAQTNGSTVIFLPVHLPHGSKWVFMSAWYEGSPTDTIIPANQPTIQVYKEKLQDGSGGSIASQTDALSLTPFQARHELTVDCGNEVIDNENYRYMCSFRNEHGTNSHSGLILHGFVARVAVSSQDPRGS